MGFLLSGSRKPQQVVARLMRLFCVIAPVVIGLSACSWLFGSSPPEIDTRTIDIQVTPRANHDSAVAIDIVYVFNPQLLTQLQAFGAKDWFQQRDALRALYPTELVVSSYELVPGQLGPIEKVTSKNTDAIGLFAFANYLDEGAHRARMDRFKHAVLRLEEKDLVIVPPPAS